MKKFETLKMENLIEAGNFKEVLTYCNECIRANMFHCQAFFYKAGVWIELREYEKAEVALMQGFEMCIHDSELAIMHMQKMSLYESLNKLDEALLEIDKAIDLDENAVEFYALKTALLYKMGRFIDAIRCNFETRRMDYLGVYTELTDLIRINCGKKLEEEINYSAY